MESQPHGSVVVEDVRVFPTIGSSNTSPASQKSQNEFDRFGLPANGQLTGRKWNGNVLFELQVKNNS